MARGALFYQILSNLPLQLEQMFGIIIALTGTYRSGYGLGGVI